LTTISVAVVVPTLNEQEALRQNLPDLAQDADEIIVSDGGSTDSTLITAEQFGAKVVTGAHGRGPQLNRGALAVESEVILFLHADTRLPERGIERVRQAVIRGKDGGGFLAVFDDRRPLLRLGSTLVNVRTRLSRLPLGDQAQFVTRQAFQDLGGFRDWPILEDLDFMRRLKKYGSTTVIRQPVTTSARRYVQNGIFKTIATNWWIWVLYLLGVAPDKLARLYREVR
jgi:rSAM/selenodomain-associated transferase 2